MWKFLVILKADVRVKDVRFLYSPVERAPIPYVLAPGFWPPGNSIIWFHCQFLDILESTFFGICTVFVLLKQAMVSSSASKRLIYQSVRHQEESPPTICGLWHPCSRWKESSHQSIFPSRKCWLLTLDSLTNWQCKFRDEGKQELATYHNVDIWNCKNGPSFYQCFHLF